jgi:hypothetical protein
MSFRAGVAARLGYEPFGDRAELLVSATVDRAGRVLEAKIEIAGADGKSTAERKLTSRQSDCLELASAIELAISIVVDPPAIPGASPAARTATSGSPRRSATRSGVSRRPERSPNSPCRLLRLVP